jgi:hypothetical protein
MRPTDRRYPCPEVLTGVAFKEGDSYIAVCLQYYLLVQVDSEEELPGAIKDMLAAHVVACREFGAEPFQDLPPAPQRFWAMYDAISADQVLRPGVPHELLPTLASVEFRESFVSPS